MSQCTATPGCQGTVVDGYCDHCGMAPRTPTPAARTSTPQAQAYTPAPTTVSSGRGSSSIPSSPSARTGSQPILSTRTGSGSNRTTGRTASSGGGRRGGLGAGLVEVPPVPYRDPASAIMKNPEVAERKRFCSTCGNPVGRSRNGMPGRTEGFCPKDGTPFSFTPKLNRGDMVGGQYKVLGCLAHGGLGWIYLAQDKNVNDKWVVLKGLLDTGDAEAMAAALAEMAFLAEVEHPNIVKIINFVQHPEPKTGTLVGYIVMEYIGGQSLKDVLAEHRKLNGNEASLPLPQVIAYGIEILRAFGYLHNKGLLYCDFKPDNAIQSEEQLKLLDLGGVRRIDDDVSPIYGTQGYQAPEVPTEGPSISSDLYTVGRSLAVLSFPFRFASTYVTSLPPREEVKVLMAYESYDRWLRRACHEDPLERFQDAAEMAEQLTGVLREVLSLDDGKVRPAASTLFGPERTTAGADIDALATVDAPRPEASDKPAIGELDPREAALALPVPVVYASDPAAAFLAGLTIREPDALAAALESAPVQSPEVSFMLTRVRIELGQFGAAEGLLNELLRTHSGDWRVDWYRGLAALASRRFVDARQLFEGLYTWMPGELAPKLGLAFSCELMGDLEAAAQRYQAVWRTDHGHVSAAFGLARVRLASGDRTGAVNVLNTVPDISSRYVAAQVAAVAAAVRGRTPQSLSEPELAGAGHRLATLGLDKLRHGRLSAEVLETGLEWVLAGRQAAQGTNLFGAPMVEKGLREKLESTYRELARLAQEPADRHTLVLRANAVRPRTLF